MKVLIEQSRHLWEIVQASTTSSEFYVQLGAVVAAVLVALFLSLVIRRRVSLFEAEPKAGALFSVRQALYRAGSLVFPVLTIVALGAAIAVTTAAVGQSWLIRLVQSMVVVILLYRSISRFVHNSFFSGFFKWVVIPLATLSVFGWLDQVTVYFDALSLEVGTIRVSALSLGRTLIFGGVLFWLGNISSAFGKQVIRNRQTLDIGTREVATKLFEIALFVTIFLLLLGVMGINLTALAVFGGALGVGLGFGLQQIAANFISGIIILLDRSITIGDYIEFDDGRAGTLRELNMRSTTLETFDGKDIMVPNEQFITSAFVNWTHKNKKQRYSLEFSVAYRTDLHKMLRIVKEVVASHPKVLTGPELPIEERPDTEISSFGDSGVNILVEFWMLGIDDGENRVGGDLLLMIWDALKERDIEIPFPQRDVRIVKAD
ncbi:MAG: mechanosensitive ion channel [Chloroflexi bacterium]|nr:mechanosensitive ion channel [Chloroflexota bacterium]